MSAHERPVRETADSDGLREAEDNQGVLVLDPPAATPVDDAARQDGDPTGDLDAERLRARLIELINGSGPGLIVGDMTGEGLSASLRTGGGIGSHP